MYEKPSKTQRRTIPRILHGAWHQPCHDRRSCFFAYRQTSSTLEENLNSLTEIAELPTAAVTDQIQAPVIGVKTDVAKETQTVTSAAAQTQAETQAETEALTDAPETQPEAEAPAHHLTAPLTEYTVLAPFSAGELVKSETTGTWQTHNGVDLACEAVRMYTPSTSARCPVSATMRCGAIPSPSTTTTA